MFMFAQLVVRKNWSGNRIVHWLELNVTQRFDWLLFIVNRLRNLRKYIYQSLNMCSISITTNIIEPVSEDIWPWTDQYKGFSFQCILRVDEFEFVRHIVTHAGSNWLVSTPFLSLQTVRDNHWASAEGKQINRWSLMNANKVRITNDMLTIWETKSTYQFQGGTWREFLKKLRFLSWAIREDFPGPSFEFKASEPRANALSCCILDAFQ